MRCSCPVDPMIVGSRVVCSDRGRVDILSYRCPVCKAVWSESIERQNSDDAAADAGEVIYR